MAELSTNLNKIKNNVDELREITGMEGEVLDDVVSDIKNKLGASVSLLNITSSTSALMTSGGVYYGSLPYRLFKDLRVTVTNGCKSLVSAFRNFTTLESVSLNEDSDTSNVASISNMFTDSKELKYVNLGNQNFEILTTAAEAFLSCSKLQEVNLENIKFISCRDFTNMFGSCNNLTKITGTFSIQGEAKLGGMFGNCSKLESVSFDKSLSIMPTTATSMFSSCSSLTELDLSNIYISNTVSIAGMFRYCSGLRKLDIRNFEFKSDDNWNYTFQNVPNDCLIIVKDDNNKQILKSKKTTLTNVKTVAEYESEV